MSVMSCPKRSASISAFPVAARGRADRAPRVEAIARRGVEHRVRRVFAHEAEELGGRDLWSMP
jgi:hypothetical protein